MSLIPLPSGLNINGLELRTEAVTRAHYSPFGGDGAESVVDLLQDRWRASLSTTPMRRPDAGAVEAWLDALNGGINTTALHHAARPVPLGTLGRVHPVQGLLADAPQGAASVQLATTPGATLLAGDMLGLGGDEYGQGGLLLRCLADCVANASGVITVPLTRRLRRAVSGLRRASAGTYLDGAGLLQTAGVNVPRFQGGRLLVEAASTNLLTSSDIADCSVSGTGAFKSGVSVTLPNGLVGSCTEVTTGTDIAGCRFGGLTGADPGNGHTGSIWARSVSGTLTATMDVNDQPHSVQTIDTTWRRIDSYGDPTLTTPYRFFDVTIVAGAAGRKVQFWGSQLEPGALTSYMPTSTTAATRAADVVTAVRWDKPARPFRLVGVGGVRHVPGSADGFSRDFVEDLST